MKIVQVELSDGRSINVREPWPSEFREARRALAELAKMESLIVDAKNVQAEEAAALLTDPRLDGLTTAEVIALVGKLSGLGEEADRVGMSDYFALLVALAQVIGNFTQPATKASSSTSAPEDTDSLTGLTN